MLKGIRLRGGDRMKKEWSKEKGELGISKVDCWLRQSSGTSLQDFII